MILKELKAINDRLQRFPHQWQGSELIVEAADRLNRVIFEVERLATNLSRPRDERTAKLVNLVERGATVTSALSLVLRQEVEQFVGENGSHG